MDLTIIIPCHNLEKWIDPLLNSLEIQTFDPFTVELIFVLDDCTDFTGKKLLQHDGFKQYESVLIMNVVNHSCGLSRNDGLKKAKGDYIWFIDGDDWLLDSKAIHKILTIMKVQDEKIIRFDYEAPKFKLHGYPSMVWQYCMRRDFIGDLRFTAIQPHEDVKFMGSLTCDLDTPIYFINEKFYYYNYMREGSNMQQWIDTKHIEP